MLVEYDLYKDLTKKDEWKMLKMDVEEWMFANLVNDPSTFSAVNEGNLFPTNSNVCPLDHVEGY